MLASMAESLLCTRGDHHHLSPESLDTKGRTRIAAMRRSRSYATLGAAARSGRMASGRATPSRKGESGRRRPPSPSKEGCGPSVSEAEVEDVAVLDDVVLTLQPQLARVAGAGLALQCNVIRVGDGLGADEALFEVGVDHARRLGRPRAARHRPRPRLLGADGEVGVQAQKLVAGTDHAVE